MITGKEAYGDYIDYWWAAPEITGSFAAASGTLSSNGNYCFKFGEKFYFLPVSDERRHSRADVRTAPDGCTTRRSTAVTKSREARRDGNAAGIRLGRRSVRRCAGGNVLYGSGKVVWVSSESGRWTDSGYGPGYCWSYGSRYN
jgi:hypothetical protein